MTRALIDLSRCRNNRLRRVSMQQIHRAPPRSYLNRRCRSRRSPHSSAISMPAHAISSSLTRFRQHWPHRRRARRRASGAPPFRSFRLRCKRGLPLRLSSHGSSHCHHRRHAGDCRPHDGSNLSGRSAGLVRSYNAKLRTSARGSPQLLGPQGCHHSYI